MDGAGRDAPRGDAVTASITTESRATCVICGKLLVGENQKIACSYSCSAKLAAEANRQERVTNLRNAIENYLGEILHRNDPDDKLPKPRVLHEKLGDGFSIHVFYKYYHNWRVMHANHPKVKAYLKKYEHW
jgi:hypothetical protein